MKKKFTLLLLGPAGSGKSTLVAGLSKIDILPYISAKTQGGANTTKVLTTYEFSNVHNDFQVIDCETVEGENRTELLSELQQLSKEENGIKKVFENINDSKFAKKCISITIQLPCKENLIPKNGLFNTVVVRDSRGFGDIDDQKEIKTEDLGITDDINAILFMAISSIQQPAIFSKIIDDVMKYNLKTPMFLLRRDEDLTHNDVNFEQKILTNISNTDNKLSEAIVKINTPNKNNRLNHFVFNLPEVKSWKGALNVDTSQTQNEITSYSQALEEILNYSLEMYLNLYKVIAEELQEDYKDRFVNEILNNLISTKAFKIAANIVDYPTVVPHRDYYTYRDTKALASPVNLYGNKQSIGDSPYQYEVSKHGNRHADGIIPSYSYACINFRNIFKPIVNVLSTDYKLTPLFSTLLDIVLEESTINTSTGYTNRICSRDAFKFNLMVETRDKCTAILAKHNLVEESNKEEWKSFTFSNYSSYKAIAVFVYQNLILSLNLAEKYNQYKDTKIDIESLSFIDANNKEEILNQLQRN